MGAAVLRAGDVGGPTTGVRYTQSGPKSSLAKAWAVSVHAFCF
jgi:hypothetical protein